MQSYFRKIKTVKRFLSRLKQSSSKILIVQLTFVL